MSQIVEPGGMYRVRTMLPPPPHTQTTYTSHLAELAHLHTDLLDQARWLSQHPPTMPPFAHHPYDTQPPLEALVYIQTNL
jgi:hypothetical protein